VPVPAAAREEFCGVIAGHNEGTSIMLRDDGMNEKAKQAKQAYLVFETGSCGNANRKVRRFCQDRPDDAKALRELFDATHPGLNYGPARIFTRPMAKVRIVLEDAKEAPCGLLRGRGWARRRKLLVSFIVFVLALPMILAPTHPIAAYSYLADRYDSWSTQKVFANTNSDTNLTAFLISPAQIERYRGDLLEDMLDTRSGRLFAIVRRPDGFLEQESVRTWNGFLPAALPSFVAKWLDRKELPFLGDEVELWLQGNEIVAMGHYHAFGGGPSAGDKIAQNVSGLSEVVVANGVIPMVYLDSALVPYGEDVVVPEDVFRSMRALERSLSMDVENAPSIIVNEPSQSLKSFLVYLRDYRNVDVSGMDTVAKGTLELCLEFKDQCRAVFTDGFTPAPYLDNPDKSNLLRNVAPLQGWADIYKSYKSTPEN